MYKIYINDCPLVLGEAKELTHFEGEGESLLTAYPGKQKHLHAYIDWLEKAPEPRWVGLYSPDTNTLWETFQSLYLPIQAAGGVVTNPHGQLLGIYRNGYWDLPKGKVDPGETHPEAALREVEEETAAAGLQLGPYLQTTFHTYQEKKKRILKHTHWYEMTCPEQPLHPQAEEGIERAEWIAPLEFLETHRPMFNSIRDVVHTFLSKA